MVPGDCPSSNRAPTVLLGNSQAVQKGDPSQGAKGPHPLFQIPLTWIPATSSIGHKGSPRTLEWVAYPFSRGSS